MECYRIKANQLLNTTMYENAREVDDDNQGVTVNVNEWS
jgi:hypothetical protein